MGERVGLGRQLRRRVGASGSVARSSCLGSVGLAPYTDDDDATITWGSPGADGFQHLDRAGRVGVVRRHRVGERAGHRGPGREVHDRAGAGQHVVERGGVEEVARDQPGVDAVQVVDDAGGQVVERDDLVDAGVRASAGTGWRR